MDIEDALKFTDNLALTTTGKHLDSLQKAILRGTWNNQKYKEIAEDHHRSEKYVKEVGFKLWKLLSVALGEEQVCKANFRAKLENLRVGNISLFGNGCIHIGNISGDSSQSSKNLQPEPQSNDKFNEPTSNTQPKVCQDLSDAPEPNLFYNRTSELTNPRKLDFGPHPPHHHLRLIRYWQNRPYTPTNPTSSTRIRSHHLAKSPQLSTPGITPNRLN